MCVCVCVYLLDSHNISLKIVNACTNCCLYNTLGNMLSRRYCRLEIEKVQEQNVEERRFEKCKLTDSISNTK